MQVKTGSDIPLLVEALERGKLLEKGIKFLLLRIERVESERDRAIKREQDFRDRLAILGESE